MKFLNLRFFVLPIAIACASCQFSAPLQAQPPAAKGIATLDDWAAFGELGKQLKDAEPQVAIDTWRKFFESRPKMAPGLALTVSGNIADLYGDKLKNKDKVLEIADWSLKTYDTLPDVVFMLWRKAKTLNELKRYDDTAKLYEENWNVILRGGQSGATWIAMYAACTLREVDTAYDALGQGEKSVPMIVRAFNAMPALLDDMTQGLGGWKNGWMYESLVGKLIKAEKTDDAARWAKMHYATGAFDKDCLARANTSLGKVWGELEEYQKIRTFASLQEEGADPAIKNPLADVKLPELDEKQLREHLARLRIVPQAKFNRAEAKELITLLIATGDFGGAMTTARRLMKDDPTKDDGPLQVCRVFKAADNSTRRANQYLLFLESKAENPLPAFMQQFPPKTDAAAGAK